MNGRSESQEVELRNRIKNHSASCQNYLELNAHQSVIKYELAIALPVVLRTEIKGRPPTSSQKSPEGCRVLPR